MVTKKKGLGLGLEALLGSGSKPVPLLDEIPIDRIEPGRFQPRKTFAEDKLEELAESIRVQGVVQPIVVRETGEAQYEIIAGERRWRAAQRAELTKIPAIVRQVDDEAAIAMSLIENIQREDLNPIEEAQALQRLLEKFKLTHQELANAVGKSRVAVTNYLRLNGLSPMVKEMLAEGTLEMGHARALLSLSNANQDKVARDIRLRQLSVRETEGAVRGLSRNDKESRAKKSADTRHLEEKLGTLIGQPVAIQHTAKGKGKVVISYNNLDELEGILSHFGDLE